MKVRELLDYLSYPCQVVIMFPVYSIDDEKFYYECVGIVHSPWQMEEKKPGITIVDVLSFNVIALEPTRTNRLLAICGNHESS